MEVIISVIFLGPLLASSVCRLHQYISSEHLIKGHSQQCWSTLLPLLRLHLIIHFCFCLQHTKRKLDDVSKRLEALYDKLRDQKVTEICVTCSARLPKAFLIDIFNPFALDLMLFSLSKACLPSSYSLVLSYLLFITFVAFCVISTKY